MTPRITIVTPSFNQGRFLEETLRSVLDQGYPDLELMVFDGGSTDGSVEILERLGPRLAYWESVPDEGQSHAIEKGMRRATGELLNWLNSDDVLLPGSLRRIAEAYRESGAELVVGEDDHFTDAPGRPVRRFRPQGYAFPECLRFWSGGFRYHQPCTFFTRDLYLRSGGIDRTLHYVMDYDLYCRMLAVPGVRVAYVGEPLSAFRLHEDAKTSAFRGKFLDEQRAVSRRYWSGGRLEEGIALAEMNRYSAMSRVFLAADAFRRRRLAESARWALDALRFSPGHAVGVFLARGARRLSRPSESL